MRDRWKPKETAPRDGENFVAWSPSVGLLFTVHWDAKEQAFYTDYERWNGHFTHWMKLPEPPQ